MAYKIIIPNHVTQNIRHFHPRIKKIIRDGIEVIAMDPSLGKDLKDELVGYKAFKLGRYRIVFKIEGKSVVIFALGHRATIYLETLRLLQKKN